MKETISAPIRLQKLVLADKLANLRSIYKDFSEIGNELWARFNAGAGKQAWYYGKMTEVLVDMQDCPEAETFYWELVGLYKDVFVKYYLDEENEVIFQENILGEAYWLKKGTPQWRPVEKEKPLEVRTISRKVAEGLEDDWNKVFWRKLELDKKDRTCKLFSAKEVSLYISIDNEKLTFHGEHFGSDCVDFGGKDEFEYHYPLDKDNTTRLLTKLRMKYGFEKDLEEIILGEFGTEEGSMRFRSFCERNYIVMGSFSI